MFDRDTGDKDFIAMMHDFTATVAHQPVSTEVFKYVLEKHMKPAMDLDRNRKMDWFFDEWVYGTGIPTLKLTYSVKGKPGAYKLVGSVAQSDVTDDFSVTVPVEIQTGRGKVVQQVRTGSDAAPFSVTVTALGAKATLDPAASVLRR